MTVSETFAKRVRESRTRRGWSQAQLAERVTELGHPLDKATIAKIERAALTDHAGKARRVTIDDAVALAVALGQPLLALLVPDDEGEDVELTPEVRVRARFVQSWMAGTMPLRREDVDNYRDAALALVDILFLGRDLPRLLQEQPPSPEEVEAMLAYIEKEKLEIRDQERVAFRPGTPEEIVRVTEDSRRSGRDRLAELEQLIPATPTTTTKSKSRTTTIAATKGKKTIRAKTPKRTTKEKRP